MLTVLYVLSGAGALALLLGAAFHDTLATWRWAWRYLRRGSAPIVLPPPRSAMSGDWLAVLALLVTAFLILGASR